MRSSPTHPKSTSHLEAKNIHFSWHEDRLILDDVSVVIPKGKITAIMGPSGSGKTTLLSILSTQVKPQSGKVWMDGLDLYSLSKTKTYQLRQKIGMLFQESGLFTDMTVFDNVAFPLREHTRLPEDVLQHLILMKLEAVGLRGARDLMPHQLSGGMARRVALARALALDPELIFYDEPFTGLDPITKGVILKLIKQLTQTIGLTSVLVSHDVAEASSIADYVYLMSRGQVIAEGPPDVLFQSDQLEVKQFMHGLPEGPVPFHYPGKAYEEELLT